MEELCEGAWGGGVLRNSQCGVFRYHELQVFQVLQLRGEKGLSLPEGYEEAFYRADRTFLHQPVYDMERQGSASCLIIWSKSNDFGRIEFILAHATNLNLVGAL